MSLNKKIVLIKQTLKSRIGGITHQDGVLPWRWKKIGIHWCLDHNLP